MRQVQNKTGKWIFLPSSIVNAPALLGRVHDAVHARYIFRWPGQPDRYEYIRALSIVRERPCCVNAPASGSRVFKYAGGGLTLKSDVWWTISPVKFDNQRRRRRKNGGNNVRLNAIGTYSSYSAKCGWKETDIYIQMCTGRPYSIREPRGERAEWEMKLLPQLLFRQRIATCFFFSPFPRHSTRSYQENNFLAHISNCTPQSLSIDSNDSSDFKTGGGRGQSIHLKQSRFQWERDVRAKVSARRTSQVLTLISQTHTEFCKQLKMTSMTVDMHRECYSRVRNLSSLKWSARMALA